MAIKIGGTTVIDDSRNITDNIGTIPASKISGSIPVSNLSIATTQAESDNSTKIATTAYVTNKITTLIGGAPGTLNDLNELAAAINDDANYNSTLTTALATKLPLAGGTLTGDLILSEGSPTITLTDTDGNTSSHIKTVGSNMELHAQHGNMRFRVGSSGLEHMRIAPGGDISFYEDTGTTAKFFWDASTERLGIGTASPQKKLEVTGDLQLDANNASIWLKSGAAGTDGRINWTYDTDSTVYASAGLNYDTRGSTGFHLDVGYPITIDTSSSTGIKFITAASQRAIINNSGLSVTGNIAVSGTVDGRDVATDGTKLDGIETGATADQTAAQLLTAIKTVDGAGSGLDADLLDGATKSTVIKELGRNSLTSSDNLDTISGYGWYGWSSSNPSNSPAAYGVLRYLHDGSQDQQWLTTYGGSANKVELYGRRKTSGTWDTSWTRFWSDENDGSGSGLDADTVDGIQGSSFLRSDANDSYSGVLTGGELAQGVHPYHSGYYGLWNTEAYNGANASYMIINAGADTYITGNSSVYIRGANNSSNNQLQVTTGGATIGGNTVWHAGNDGSGTGLDADLLDGLHASELSYLPIGSRYTGNASSISASSYRLWDVSTGNDAPTSALDGLLLTGYWDSTTWATQQYHDFHSNDLFIRNKYSNSWQSWDKVWTSGNDGSGSGLDADTVDGIEGSSFLRSNASDTATGSISFTNSYNEFGNSTSSVSNDGSWNARVNIAGSSHARLDVKSVSDGIITSMYSHNGHNAGKIGTYSNHQLKFIINGTDKATLSTAGSLSTTSQGTLWGASNDGSGSGLDADTVDGIQASSFLRNDASNTISTYTNRTTFYSNTNAGLTNSHQSSLEVKSDGAGNDAFMQFHVGGDYATYFGLDGDTNDLFVGGWSKGSTRYKMWHQGNDGSGSGLDADTVDGLQASSFLRSDADDSYDGNLSVNNMIFKNNSNVDRNFKMQPTGTSTDAGISLFNGPGAWVMQLYGNSGSGGEYGFLDANWGGWDIRKIKNGRLYLNGNNTYYVDPEGTSKFNAITSTGSFTTTSTGSFGGKVDFQGDAAIEGGSGYGVFKGYTANDNHFISVRGAVSNSSTLTITGAHQTTFVEHADASNEGWYFKSKTSGSYREIARIDGVGDMYLEGSKVWHAGNDGPGSGLYADTVGARDFASGSFTVGGDADTYYPCTFWGGGQDEVVEIEIYRPYSTTAPSTWNTSTHKGGLTFKMSVNFGGWGGSNYNTTVSDFREIYSTICTKIGRFGNNRGFAIWLRGGTALYYYKVRGRTYGPAVRLTAYDPGGNNTGVSSQSYSSDDVNNTIRKYNPLYRPNSIKIYNSSGTEVNKVYGASAGAH